MDSQDLKKIVDLMISSDLTEFEIEQEGLKLKIKRSSECNGQLMHPPMPVASYPSFAPAPQQAQPSKGSPSTGTQETEKFEVIKSPMVGTFYRSPSPDSPPFVNIGSAVEQTTVVCILEAMKVLNEIHAEIKGTIVEVLIENGQTVEYGQPLFKVKPV